MKKLKVSAVKAARPVLKSIPAASLKAHAKKVVVRKAAAKKSPATANGYILSAPKGARRLTHRQIEKAVKSVFEERLCANG